MADRQIESNRRYNAERKAQAELMKRDLDRDQILTQLYQESFDRMQREIDSFYMRYAGREGLTKQEAIKRAAEMDVTRFADKAAKAVREKDFSHETNEWLRVYNLKMKVSRLELLKAELALEIQNLAAEVDEVFDKARHDEYLNEYKRQAGILGISSSGAKKRLKSILDADFYGQNFSSRVWGATGLQASLQRDVFGSLNRIYTDMMGYKQEMKRLSKKYGTSEANAKRLLKTEIARINADTQLRMLKDNGFTHMIFVAEPGACDICGPLDKMAIPIDKVEKGVNMFPMHPNCRCSSYGHIKMDYKKGGSTLDREAVNGVWGEEKTKPSSEKPRQITGDSRYLIGYSKDEIFVANDSDEIDSYFKEQKSYQKWYNELSEEQKKAINYYTREEGYTRINGILRSGKENYEQEAYRLAYDRDKPYIQETIKEASQAMDVLKTVNDFVSEKSFKTYRGISFWDREDIYSDLQIGENTILDRGFMSTSLDKTIIDDFADGGREYRFEITVPKGYNKGKYIGELSDIPEEREFLFDPDSKFKIVDIQTEGSVTNVIAEAIYD